MATNNRPLKAYVRYDGSGRAVSSSLIWRKNKPKVGNWKEVQGYECCNSGGGGECECTTGTLSLSYSLQIGYPPDALTGFGISCPSVSGFEYIVLAGTHMQNWVTDNGGDVNAVVAYLNLYFSNFGTWEASEGGVFGVVTLNFNSCSEAPLVGCVSPQLEMIVSA